MKKFVLVLVFVGIACFGDGNLSNFDNGSYILGDFNHPASSLESENLDSNYSSSNLTNAYNDLNSSNLDESNINKEDEKFSLYSLYKNADIVVKVVIYILVAFSVISWMVFIAKILEFRFYSKRLNKDIKILKGVKFIDELSNLSGISKSLVKEIEDEFSKDIGLKDLNERLRVRLETRLLSITNQTKNYTSILASIGSSAPFIGLFGTVWGIMNSFIGIATSSNAGLDVVAPGIAEALFATAFGLAAAIPAVLFYNYILRKNGKILTILDEISSLIYVIALRSSPKW